mgnify:CR=1 FL=1
MTGIEKTVAGVFPATVFIGKLILLSLYQLALAADLNTLMLLSISVMVH